MSRFSQDEEGGNTIRGRFEEYHDDDVPADGPAAFNRHDSPIATRPDDFEESRASKDVSWTSRVSDRIPHRLKRISRAVVNWVKGPDPPRPYRIQPWFPSVQHAPLMLLDRYAPKRMQKFGLLVAVCALWLLSFSLILHQSAFASEVEGYGAPVRLGCGSRYWSGGNDCGLNGDQCRPFANASLAFRCPANCINYQILNPHAVGDQEVNYRPLVVGGPKDQDPDKAIESAVYRGDSFICGSAVHAGFISDRQGGCGALKLIGEREDYPRSDRNQIESVAFPSYFPQSFSFIPGTQAQCEDLRWPALVISVFFTALLSLFTTSPAIFFWSVFTALFFHVGLASDPPSLMDYHSLISIAVGRFLPAAFVGWIVYRYCVRLSLRPPGSAKPLTAQIEKTILWLGPAWTGALNNYTFDKIPLQRLTPHDIRAQPGAVPALVGIVLAIFFIALGQAWAFRVEGRMPRYLALYGILGLSLLSLVAVPDMNVRIHHYVLALLLLPGTAIQNRPSLVYQGLLVGLFVNGIARWGFDSLLQTPDQLFSGAQKDTALPAIAAPVIGHGGMATPPNITFALPRLPHTVDGRTYDGLSVLVNDVERFRSYVDFDTWTGDWTWQRHRAGAPEYFRFAFLDGSLVADFTKAGVWEAEGAWREMEAGPSR
ncbi:hypothetical protein LTR66_012201 [Elasticomyces elasticus]|nr:hypothetical protein LTR66_012201 [Elasticomyces elasticus]